MFGRGLRPSEGKLVATIFDHGGCVYEHGFADAVIEWSLNGGARKARLRQAREAGEVIRRCPGCSCVHEMAATCPECGYEYASRFEVGEYDGVLYELRDGPPPGYVTQAEFARQIGRISSWVGRQVKRGLPSVGGYIDVGAAKNWISQNVKQYLSAGRHRVHAESPNDYLNCRQAGIRYGIGGQRISTWIRRGKLKSTDGFVKITDLEKFLASLPERRNRGTKMPAKGLAGCESRQKFSRRAGVSLPTVCGWAEKGLPLNQGMVPIEAGLAWVRQNVTVRAVLAGHEERKAFGRRVGKTGSCISQWCHRGLPSGPDKLIPIAAGLAWVQANTKIAIPASAWEGVDSTDDQAEAAD